MSLTTPKSDREARKPKVVVVKRKKINVIKRKGKPRRDPAKR